MTGVWVGFDLGVRAGGGGGRGVVAVGWLRGSWGVSYLAMSLAVNATEGATCVMHQQKERKKESTGFGLWDGAKLASTCQFT